MSLFHIVVIIQALMLMVFMVVIYRLFMKTNRRIDRIQQTVRYLSSISKYVQDFIEKGERPPPNISEELTLKQNVIDKLTAAPGKVFERTGGMEESTREKKLDRETIDKILILVNQDFKPGEIARKLNIPLGEVELVIKLKRYPTTPLKDKL